jgi:hypothetical protein
MERPLGSAQAGRRLSHTTMSTSTRGAALIDVLFACCLCTVIAAIAVPTVNASRDRDAARGAAQYLAKRMQMLRLEALKRSVHVALRFDPIEIDLMGVYADGDADGVQQSDVHSGIDSSIGPDSRLSDFFGAVAFEIARDVPDPDGAGMLLAGSDPIRLGATNFLSFGPLGSSTSGTIYVAAARGPQVCIRLLGATGRIRVLWFDTTTGEWRDE